MKNVTKERLRGSRQTGTGMRVKIEFTENVEEEEVIIRCNTLNDEVSAIQKAVKEITSGKQKFVFYKGDTEYYLPLEEVLFFETDERELQVHTADNVYRTRYKLYELEELLPGCFMRVSKSAILNVNRIYSITRSLSSCEVEFQNSHKQVYVSRTYMKPLKERLEEKRVKQCGK